MTKHKAITELERINAELERRREWDKIIPKLAFLYSPMRYKAARGGRGSGKSWEFARALLKMGSKTPLRVLCTREVQKSIKDSVHKLLSDQVAKLKLDSHYDILNNEIRGANGSLFIFSGLSDQTAESIKSFEGIDVCWVEEAQAVTKRSWDILIPTIRKDGSEIWISYNPELETDETHQRFAINPPDNCISVLVNHSDNPWFPEVLELERLRCQFVDPKNYDNIWEGRCKPAVEGAIYYDEMEALQLKGGVCHVPHDPRLKIHVVFDLGWNDAMAIALCQKTPYDMRVIEYIEDSHKTLAHYSNMLRERYPDAYWGKLFLPHDGKHKDYKSGLSAGEILDDLGWDVDYTDNISIEDGIKNVRMSLPRMVFNKASTERLIECLKRYKRNIVSTTGEAGKPCHDEYSHGADCLRYVCLNADKMDNIMPQTETLTMVQARLRQQRLTSINRGMVA